MALLLVRLAKMTQILIMTIGHVTKNGEVAGPRMVEHMVDAVLYLEHSTSVYQQQGHNNYRWLRAQEKNRFASFWIVGLSRWITNTITRRIGNAITTSIIRLGRLCHEYLS
jgi:predicted ATP-dependent serine protease